MKGLWPLRLLCTRGTIRRQHRAGMCLSADEPQPSFQPTFGLLFDIDGVLVRGKTPIPAARKAFQKLVNSQGQFLVPVVFVTNAGNCLRQTKADQLADILGVPISQDQVMMSHSPLRIFRQYHNKSVLVSGQGPILDIAKYLGFTNPITVDSVRESYPFLDMVDHSRRPNILPSAAVDLPKIEGYRDTCVYLAMDLRCPPCMVFLIPPTRPEANGRRHRADAQILQLTAVILFGEPIRWETNLQIIMDVLLTGGHPASRHQFDNYPHIPLLACNMDLMWMAEARSPRFGHGIFMVCLENIYKKITGKELKYDTLMGKPSEVTYHYAEYLIRTKAAEMQWSKPVQTLYAIGDNLMTDIYGANLYNRYLQNRNSRQGSTALVQAGSRAQVTTVSQEEEAAWESELSCPTATQCKSVLVCTGIYNPHAEVPADPSQSVTETVFHGHRDFRIDPALIEPGHIVPDVDAAVDLIFQLETFMPTGDQRAF